MRTKELQNLLEYFGREQACYTSLLDLSRRQQAFIEQGDVDQLLAVLAQKQQILARIAEVESHLQPYKRRWPELRGELSEDDRGVVDAALSVVEELLAELIALERRCEQELVGRIDEVRADIDAVARAQGVNGAYAARKESNAPRALDCMEA